MRSLTYWFTRKFLDFFIYSYLCGMKKLFLAVILLTVVATKAFAVRPFITDDAAIIGFRQFQLETWTLFSNSSGEYWMMWAYGLHNRMEVAVGSILGYDQSRKFTYALPLLEMKYLFREYQPNKPPGVALVTGTFLPVGKGDFVPAGYGAYSFLAVTQCFGENEDVLIHGNIGANWLYSNKKNQFLPIWGIGAQIRAYRGLHLVGELISGDPYVPGTGIAFQTGFRYFISDLIQIDATIGQGIAGKNKLPFWGGFGLRLVI